jgi:hypothetical protein
VIVLASILLHDLTGSIESEREASENGSGALELQLSELQKRYDNLLDTYERAGEKYKSDYTKWMGFKAWLFSDDAGEDGAGASGKKRARANFMRKKRLVKGMACVGTTNAGNIKEEGNFTSFGCGCNRIQKKLIDCPPPLGDISNPFLADKENQSARASNGDSPQPKKIASSRLSATAFKPEPTDTTYSTRMLVKVPPKLVEKSSVPSSSPSMFLCPSSSTTTVRGTITFKPIPSSVLQPKQQLELVVPLFINLRTYNTLRPTPSKAEKRRNSPNNIFDSSDTEEDTQGSVHTLCVAGILTFLLAAEPQEQVFKVPDIPAFASSETEEDTQRTL